MRMFVSVLPKGAIMPHPAPRTPPSTSPRRATNVTLPETLLRDAREMGINLSQACERGLAAEVAESRRRRWLEENREAMDAWNEHVAAHGLPLAAFRQF
jgi:antitoxin CcdA